MQILLQLTTEAGGTRRGTARRTTDAATDALEFHGVLELIGVLDRLLDDDRAATTERPGRAMVHVVPTEQRRDPPSTPSA